MTNDHFTHEGGVKDQAAQQAGEVKDHAAQQAGEVKDHAVGAAKDVAQTAGTEAKTVVRDARTELRGLVDNGLNELNSQAGTGQNRLAAELRNVVDELGEMVQGSQHNGMATQFARELSDRGNGLVGWLETHEPRDALDQVRRYAARNPWTFLAVAAGAGLLVGRFARGLKDDSAPDDTYAAGYAQPPQPRAYASGDVARAYGSGQEFDRPAGYGYESGAVRQDPTAIPPGAAIMDDYPAGTVRPTPTDGPGEYR